MSTFYAVETWKQQCTLALWQPAHTDITISKFGMPHPTEAGFTVSGGELVGQNADYRLPLDDGREVHVREFSDRYTVHWDKVSALRNPIGHIGQDAPHWLVIGLTGAIFLGIVLSGEG